MKKKVLIIGSNGFLGNALWNYMGRKYPRYELYGIDLKKDKSDSRKLVCNLLHINKLRRILSDINPSYIFHLAGGRVSDERKMFKNNLEGTLSFLKIVEELKMKSRIVIASSAAEYGMPSRHKRKISETNVCLPVSYYGVVKLLETNVGLLYSQKGLNVIIARMFNICGYNTPNKLSLGRFADEIVKIEMSNGKKNSIKVGSLEGKRDFLDINDICSGLFSLALKGKSGQVYNICSGNAIGMRDALYDLIKFSCVDNIIVDESSKKISDSYNVVGSNTKICKETNWRPKVSFRKSLIQMLESYRQKY